MRIFVDPTRQNAVQLRVAALVLLAVVLVIPQLTWADHASDHPYSQFDDPALVSPSEGYADLATKFRTGELEFHTPGRRDDRSFSASAGSARWVAQGKYYMEESERAAAAGSARWVAQGKYYMEESGRGAAADSARWVAQGKYHMEESERAAAADSARWVALGEYYTDDTGRDAAFLAANPEIRVFMSVVQDGCSKPGQVC
jgi:hypothetical protein